MVHYDYRELSHQPAATEEELLLFSNIVRKAGGGTIINGLLPSNPNDGTSCLVANSLNFNCYISAVRVGGASIAGEANGPFNLTWADYGYNQNLVWGMFHKDVAFLTSIYDALFNEGYHDTGIVWGWPSGINLVGFNKPNKPVNFETKFPIPALVLPRKISAVAASFDDNPELFWDDETVN